MPPYIYPTDASLYRYQSDSTVRTPKFPRILVNPNGGVNSQIASFSTSTKSILIGIPSEVDYVRFVFRSNNVTAAMTLTGSFAPTSQVGNGWSAYDANGVANTSSQWTALNFFNAGADINPEDQATGTNLTATIPNTDTYYYSDWQPITNLARIDGGTRNLVLVRTQATANPAGLTLNAAYGGLLNDIAAYDNSTAIFSSGTAVGTLSAVDFVANNIQHVWFAEFYCRKPGFGIFNVGSSLLSGTTTTNDRAPFSSIAATTLTKSGFATFVSNPPLALAGIPNLANLMLEAPKFIKTFKPRIVIIQAYNRNDTVSVAQQDTQWRAVQALIQLVQGYGGLAIIATGAPSPIGNVPDVATDNIRNINNIRARVSGYPCFDYSAFVTDGQSPERLRSELNDSGDKTHPGDTGHGRLADEFVNFLKPLLQI